MSFLNDSSRVLMDHETLASGNSDIRSRSRRIRSDLVAMLILAPLPRSCSRRERVLSNSASCGRYGSVTDPMKTSFPAYLDGSRIGGHFLTSRKVPQGSGWSVNLFMNDA